MFKDTEAFSGIAVDDIAAAKAFYEDKLGIETSVVVEDMLLTLQLNGGKRPTLLYARPNHVPAEYTVLNFPVDDVDAAVDALTERGVEFERYEGFDQDEKGIARDQGPTIAWFKDPAGNIIAVLEESPS